MPASEVILLDMAIEDGAKMVVSAGLVGAAARRAEKAGRGAKAKKPVPEEEPVV